MPNTRLIALNGSGGAYITVSATIPCRKVEIREDEGATTQGLTYQLPNDNFTAVYSVGVPANDDPQIVLGDILTHHAAQGPILGFPAQNSVGAFNYIAATALIKLRSKTGTGTSVRVTEYE